MRLGYFGGSFDPPHRGHLAVAQAAADQYSLDRVLLAPTGRQPLKIAGPEASFADRLAMVRILCEADKRFLPSTLDIPHADGTPNYTVDALGELKAGFPDADLFAIIGADALQHLPQWRDFGRLFDLANWIAVSRPTHTFAVVVPFALRHAQERGRLHLLEGVDVPFSSTELRRQLRRGLELSRDAIPEGVGHYIRSHNLYSGARGTGVANGD